MRLCVATEATNTSPPSHVVRVARAALIVLALSGCSDNSVSVPAPDVDDGADAGRSAAGSGGSGSGHSGHGQAGSSAPPAGTVDGGAGSGPPPAAGGTGTGFAQRIHPMFVMTCSACHAGTSGAITPYQGTGPGEFAVDDADAAYQAALKYLVPGTPDDSKLFIKISQEMPSTGGQRMPPLLPMPDEQIELVRAWIAAGAPPD